jgi:hypothetical protein
VQARDDNRRIKDQCLRFNYDQMASARPLADPRPPYHHTKRYFPLLISTTRSSSSDRRSSSYSRWCHGGGKPCGGAQAAEYDDNLDLGVVWPTVMFLAPMSHSGHQGLQAHAEGDEHTSGDLVKLQRRTPMTQRKCPGFLSCARQWWRWRLGFPPLMGCDRISRPTK